MIEGLSSNHFKTVLPGFEMVYWADIVHDKPLDEQEMDVNSPYYLDERYIKAPENFIVENHDTRKKVVEFLCRQLNRIFLNDDFSLNYSSITDAIVNKYFNDLEKYYAENVITDDGETYSVKDLIRNRLIRKLKEHRNDEIMLISHSMGSIIAYDVLTFAAPDIRINTLITIGSPLGLPVVISKIASEHKQMHFVVNQITTPPSILRSWNNFSDIMDRVAFNYKLSDNFSENKFGIKPVDSLVVNNYVINGERNPHKSFGYLRTPEFSKVLNEFIVSEKLSIGEKIIRKTARIIKNAGVLVAFPGRNARAVVSATK